MEFYSNKFEWLRAVMASDLTATDKMVGWAISEYLANEGDRKVYCYPNVRQIAEIVNIDYRNISRHITKLVDAGFLVVNVKIVARGKSHGYYTTKPTRQNDDSLNDTSRQNDDTVRRFDDTVRQNDEGSRQDYDITNIVTNTSTNIETNSQEKVMIEDLKSSAPPSAGEGSTISNHPEVSTLGTSGVEDLENDFPLTSNPSTPQSLIVETAEPKVEARKKNSSLIDEPTIEKPSFSLTSKDHPLAEFLQAFPIKEPEVPGPFNPLDYKSKQLLKKRVAQSRGGRFQ